MESPAIKENYLEESVIDGQDLSSRQINELIDQLAQSHSRIVVKNPGAKHNLGVGLSVPVEVIFAGNVGTYAAGLIEHANIRILGNAGWFAADNLMNSVVIIEGNAGAAGAGGMRGGLLVVKKNAASRIGQVMKGGQILIGGNAGYMTGMMMMGGRIIILGDVGGSVAESIMGGEVFVGGKIASLGKDARVADILPEELADINALIDHYLPGRSVSSLVKIVSAGKTLRYEKRYDVYNLRRLRAEAGGTGGQQNEH
jgi:glutamate synthase domain-containing protein 3